MLRISLLQSCKRLLACIVVWVGVAGVWAGESRTTVVWLSIDGLRHDYPARTETPTLDRLAQTGAFTRNLVPGFPSLTFPAHVTKATGVGVERHGIPSNRFYDSRRQRVYNYPPWAGLLEAEALWNTAARQGLRVAVHDWPLAHAQRGPHAAAVFLDRFERGLSDRERLDALLDCWQTDLEDPAREAPLQLLATWIGAIDQAGHQYGPDAPEVDTAMRESDALLGDFVERVLSRWSDQSGEGDQLVLAVTTDHGMGAVHTLVNPARLLDIPPDLEGLTLVASGTLANLHVDGIAEREEAEALLSRIEQAAEAFPFLDCYRRADLPPAWRYAHPYRTGDLVLSLRPGYTFSQRPAQGRAPVDTFGGPLGMHGYDPEIDPNMLGYAVFWRWPELWGGIEIDRVELAQLHPTLAKWLHIEPAEGADAPPLALPASGR